MNTSHRVVLPFYLYAALAFLVSAILLALSAPAFVQHYFHPHILAITHAMALGWGTMIILGASYQLVPVLTAAKLYSNTLAYISFVMAGAGIPLLVYAFYVFNIGWPARWGGWLINAAVVLYLVNLAVTISKSRKENVQAVFIFTAVCWLFITTAAGLVLVYNFNYPLLARDSLDYLPLHAHLGIAGWFLLLILGVGSRLLPMFLISKYENTGLLWWIYILINAGLLSFAGMFIFLPRSDLYLYLLPSGLVLTAVLLFAYFIYQCFRQRIKKKTDTPVRLSLLSVGMTVIPVIILLIILVCSELAADITKTALIYGFAIFFGWITVIALAMTFKTLPFIVWNKIYQEKAGLIKTPDPKDLFSSRIFAAMALIYIIGFLLFILGIALSLVPLLNTSALLLLGAAILYNLNVFKVIKHRPVVS